jgi:hypothetical protein
MPHVHNAVRRAADIVSSISTSYGNHHFVLSHCGWDYLHAEQQGYSCGIGGIRIGCHVHLHGYNRPCSTTDGLDYHCHRHQKLGSTRREQKPPYEATCWCAGLDTASGDALSNQHQSPWYIRRLDSMTSRAGPVSTLLYHPRRFASLDTTAVISLAPHKKRRTAWRLHLYTLHTERTMLITTEDWHVDLDRWLGYGRLSSWIQAALAEPIDVTHRILQLHVVVKSRHLLLWVSLNVLRLFGFSQVEHRSPCTSTSTSCPSCYATSHSTS